MSTQIPPSGAAPRFVRLPEVMQRTGLSRSSVYARMKDGRFPEHRLLGARTAVWVESELEQWLAAEESVALERARAQRARRTARGQSAAPSDLDG